MIVTPGQLAARSELYHQIGSLLAAGLPIIQALETVARRPPSPAFRIPLQKMLATLSEGETFTRSLIASSHKIPPFDVALLQAGEESGRLPDTFKLLANYYRDRAQQVRAFLGDLAYPAFLLHFAVFIGPFPEFFKTGDARAYLASTVGTLIPIYVIAIVLVLVMQGRRGERLRSMIEEILRYIPILGSARRDISLARLSVALEAQINAGISIISAWEASAAASGSPRIHRTVSAWIPRLQAGDTTPAEELQRSTSTFPDTFANLYNSGEISGRLDETLRRLHILYEEDGSRKMKLVAKWSAMLIYLAVVGRVVKQILSFYQQHFNQINQLGL